MHTSGKPFVSTPADEEQAVSLQNGAVPHTLRLDKVLMEVNSDRAHLGGDQPGTVGRRLACGFHKRWRSEHRPARVPAVFRKKTPGQPVIPRRRMPLAPRRKIRAATAVRGTSRTWPSTSRSPPSDSTSGAPRWRSRTGWPALAEPAPALVSEISANSTAVNPKTSRQASKQPSSSRTHCCFPPAWPA